MSIVILAQWFEPYSIVRPFDIFSYDALVEILRWLKMPSILAFSRTCRTMHKLFKKCMDMMLYQLADSGKVILLPIIEHKPWINRIRVHFPNFELLPVSHPDADDFDPVDPTDQFLIDLYEQSMFDETLEEATNPQNYLG